MTGHEIRRRFLEHFASREHLILPSAPLVPQGDPTTLFNSAGMQPLQPYYRGLEEPPAPRLASAQKCLRTDDIEEVGRTDRHLTFFEMMGNFAPTGDYFKARAIPWAWELVTGPFGIPAARLRVTTHPTDEEARRIWIEAVGVPAEWVHQDPTNWWGLERGPCGADSELWYDRGPEHGCGRPEPECRPDHCGRFVEIWNLVFPEFDRQADGSLPPLPRPAVDTGMGLERMASVLQGADTVFETDLLAPLVAFAADAREGRGLSQRVVADHLRAMTFLIADGVLPGNEGRGYVLRRLIRRAVLHARRTGMRGTVAAGAGIAVDLVKDQYPELDQRRRLIEEAVAAESDRFGRTLEEGMELFERVAARHGQMIPGEEAFKLHDTFGFPIDLTRELAQEQSLSVDMEAFEAAMAAQRARSRSPFSGPWDEVREMPRSEFVGYRDLEAPATVLALRAGGGAVDQVTEGQEAEVFLDRTPFYGESGGQVGDTGAIAGADGRLRVEDTRRPADGVVVHLGTVVVGTVRVGERVQAAVDSARRRQIARHHTATHLLHKALREVLGDTVVQKGSWVGPDHTTFDIPLNRAMTAAELERVGRRVNDQVRAALPLRESHRSYREAAESGAMHLFDEKYGDVVRVVSFGDWTSELCGGVHVQSTADVGPALIISESSIGAGLRRLDLVAGESAEDLVRRRLDTLAEVSRTLGGSPDEASRRLAELTAEMRRARRQIAQLTDRLRVASVQASGAGTVSAHQDLAVLENGVPVLVVKVTATDMDDLRAYADRYSETMERPGVVVATSPAISAYVVKVAREHAGDKAGEIDGNRLKALLGPGGGRPALVQGRLERPTPAAADLRGLLG